LFLIFTLFFYYPFLWPINLFIVQRLQILQGSAATYLRLGVLGVNSSFFAVYFCMAE